MEDALCPLFGGGAELEGDGTAWEIQVQEAAFRGEGSEVLEDDFEPLGAAKEDVVAFEAGFAGERAALVVHAAVQFLSHIPSWGQTGLSTRRKSGALGQSGQSPVYSPTRGKSDAFGETTG